MRKKLLICSIVMSLSLLGCSDTKADKAVNVTSDSQMEMVYEESKDTYQEAFCIYRNTITDVLYLWIDLLLVVCTSIIGCSDTKDKPKSKAENYVNSVELEFTENEENENQMELVCKEHEDDNFTFSIYRNVVTDVLYLWANSFRAGGFQEMHDPETGLPLTYEKYKELSKDSH